MALAFEAKNNTMLALFIDSWVADEGMSQFSLIWGWRGVIFVSAVVTGYSRQSSDGNPMVLTVDAGRGER